MLLTAAAMIHGLLYAAAAGGCGLLLYAARRESRGDLETAVRLVRVGGFVMAGATLATAASGPALLALLPASTKQALLTSSENSLALLALVMMATVVAGFVGLLAGLSGKPRPSGYVAVVLFLVAVASLVVASRPAWRFVVDPG